MLVPSFHFESEKLHRIFFTVCFSLSQEEDFYLPTYIEFPKIVARPWRDAEMVAASATTITCSRSTCSSSASGNLVAHWTFIKYTPANAERTVGVGSATLQLYLFVT